MELFIAFSLKKILYTLFTSVFHCLAFSLFTFLPFKFIVLPQVLRFLNTWKLEPAYQVFTPFLATNLKVPKQWVDLHYVHSTLYSLWMLEKNSVIYLSRDWTRLSCIGRWILYHWAKTGAHETTITLPWTLFSSAVKRQWWTLQLKTPTLISLKPLFWPLFCSYENSCVASVLRQHFFFFSPQNVSFPS